MDGSRLARLGSLLAGTDLVMGLLWLGLAAFSIALVVLIWTRWGQYRPLRKCLLLSLLAHVLLAGYATTIELVATVPTRSETVLNVALLDCPPGPGVGPGDPAGAMVLADSSAAADPQADAIPVETNARAAGSPDEQPQVPAMPDASAAAAREQTPAVADEAARAMPEPSAPAAEASAGAAPPSLADAPAARAADASASRREMPPSVDDSGQPGQWAIAPTEGKVLGGVTDGRDRSPLLPSQRGNDMQRSSTSVRQSALPLSPFPLPPSSDSLPRPMPERYRLRVAGNHEGIAQGGGGGADTEAAVQAALKWLADIQAADGRWDASQHEAGRETPIDGRYRRNAGIEADTGMSGLALLALLASGHTHVGGSYQETVRRGLEYLLRSQDGAGSLAGQADSFAAMYCHAMAAFALSEAYGMTGDNRLREPVRRAIAYTVAAQHSTGGSWRYRPGDPGDTSQLGWQFMALKSAELAGIPLAESTRQGIYRYLRSACSGRHGGLSSYRPGEQVTRTMTAEALVCWQFLGLSREHPACNEAGDYLLGELPGQGRANVYYWYYATLAMRKLQGEYWRRWNDALRIQLLTTQRRSGALAGSWDPDPTWGAYGGRIYSTALSALCLEVYYRYLPLYEKSTAAATASAR